MLRVTHRICPNDGSDQASATMESSPGAPDTDAGAEGGKPPAGGQFLTRSEAARYLGVPPSTVYQWARSGRLPCVVTLGGHARFRPADLDAAKAARPRRRGGARRTAEDDQPASFRPTADSHTGPDSHAGPGCHADPECHAGPEDRDGHGGAEGSRPY
jgi:excisionase family DNA binding protein